MKMPLIGDAESLPVSYFVILDCSQDNLKKTIEEVASFVSKVYAKFPQSTKDEREQMVKRGYAFNINCKYTIPSRNECEQFEGALKERIITALSQEEGSDCEIRLSTNYSPEDTLGAIVFPIFQNKLKQGLLFPYKTCTKIFLNSTKTELKVNMNFKA